MFLLYDRSSMFIKGKYKIVIENPYSKKALNGFGLVMYCEWNDSFARVIQDNNVKHLFLNYTLGWKCSDYTFLKNVQPLETLDIIDTHSNGIKSVELQYDLTTLSLNMPNVYDIDYRAFRHLKNVFCYGVRRNDSLFSCTSIERLYIDDLKIGDNHRIGDLKNLKDLTIANSNITSLAFIRNLMLLENLAIVNCKKIQSLSDISFLRNLTRLEIRGVKGLHDISFLSTLRNIEVIIMETDALASIKPLEKLSDIKALALFGKNFIIEDMDFSPISKFGKLSMLDIPNRKCYSVKINNHWDWDDFGNHHNGNWLTEK